MFAWWKTRKSPNLRVARTPGGRIFRPMLEALEDRIVPAIDYWTGNGVTGNASEAQNWTNNVLPVNGDTAVLNGNAGANSNKAITFDAAFNIQLAQLQIVAPYTGSVRVSTNLNVTGQLSQTVDNLSVDGGQVLTAHNYYLGAGTI